MLLRVDNIRVTIGRSCLLSKVSFTSQGGEVIAVVGKNGAGKTTLLSTISGRLCPDQGIIDLDGFRPNSLYFKKMVSFLSHEPFVYPELTAQENLFFYASLYGIKDPEKAVLQALNTSQLIDKKGKVTRTLSRGELQRLAIARLLVNNGMLYLLDEPSTGLDYSSRQWLSNLIVEKAQDGKLIIFSSHDKTEVKRLSTRIILIEHGRIVLDQKTEDKTIEQAFERIERS